MNTPKELDFLLIGKTGNGKSGTGNSILRNKNVFKSTGMASSVTKKIQHGYGKHKGRVIHVVDSPGVGETRLDNAKAVLKVSKALKKAILVNPKGYHAFLILIKYGNRFTGEEQDTIKFLKDTFGANFVRDFCIQVMCGGDNFKREFEDGMPFEKWVEEQEGQLKDLILECAGRIVLFDNATKDEKEKKEQLDKLIEVVDNLSANGERYTNKNFEEAKETRDKILAEANETIISEDILKEMDLIFQKLKKIRNKLHGKPANEKLNKLKKRCQVVSDEIKTKTATSVMTSLLDSIVSLNRIIDLEIKFNDTIEKKRTDHTNLKETMKKRHEGEIEQVYLEFSKHLAEKTERVGKKEDMKEIFKKEIEEYKRMLQSGCAAESVKQRIERMELNIQGDRLENSEGACAYTSREEMATMNLQGYTREPIQEIKTLNESNTRVGGIQTLSPREKSDDAKKQSILQQEEGELKLKEHREPAMISKLNKDETFRSHLEHLINCQVEDEKKLKMEKEILQKEVIEKREELNRETEQTEDRYRAVEDQNNNSFFSKMKSWIRSLFKKMI